MNDDRPYTDETSIRWRIAHWLDKSRWTCWANLAVWAMGWFAWPWEPFWKGAKCRKDMKVNGCCWCCKFHDEKRMEELYGKREASDA